MSKLLDLLAQQKQLEEQIKNLRENEEEAKVIEFVEELETLRDKYGYSVAEFVDVVHSFTKSKPPLKHLKA